MAASLLAGCATLPSTGPTAGEIQTGTKKANPLGFSIHDIDAATVTGLSARTFGPRPVALATLAAAGANDVVGPGDVLAISVYEVGVGLFGTGRLADTTSFDPSAHAQDFPAVTVDRDGFITMPYIGALAVAGRTPSEIQAMIARGYRGKSQNPQVLVALKTNVSATIIISGEVRRPGRVELTLKREHLLDAIAEAGGTTTAPEDTIVRFSRGDRVIEERFDRIRTAATDDIALIAGDRIEIIKRPRTFLVLGATNKVTQVAFETSDVSLAEAIARVGGPNDGLANPAAIFLFRYEPSETEGQPDTPIIYRLNLLQPASYFLSQRFAMRDKDVLYFSTAASNRPSKLVGIINQLISPIISARVVAGN